jgi:hypothetical protein
VFKKGWTNVTDAEHLGFSKYTSSEKLKETRVMVVKDRIFTIAVIGQELKVSQGLMYSAVYDSALKTFFSLIQLAQYKMCA